MRHLLSTLALCTVVAMLSSCDHEVDSFAGPNLIDRFGDFAVVNSLTVSDTTVDFSAGESIVFQAQFNKTVDWEIRIEGLESGSVKIIEGFNFEVTAGNATWTGGTTQLPLFREEECMVTIRVPEEPSFGDTLNVTILGTKGYEGVLFTDFEEPGGQNYVFGNFEFELSNRTGRRDGPPASLPAEGDWYFLMEGTDDVVPNYFVGLVVLRSQLTGQTYAPLPTTVPSQLYFNCFLWHDASPHGIAIIQFAYDSNDSGDFEDGQDELFPLEIPLNWNGWRHISVRMDELGISQEKLEKIVAIRLVLISILDQQPVPPTEVRYGIDFMTFTQGQRLQL